MAQTTEAACLLQSGAMYPRRIGLRTADGQDLFAGVKPGGVSIYFGDEPIYHFDLDGRWQRAYVEGVHYLKGLDASVRSIDREREGVGMVLRRKTLPFGVAVDLDASIRTVALDLIEDLDLGRLEILEIPEKALPFAPEDFRTFLERVASWDSTAWFAHRERYLGTYGPIPFLPPDSLNALVLQATLGYSTGRAFGLARASEYYVRSRKEFEEHVRAVEKLVGRRLAQSKGIFLAGTDLLHQPGEQILGYFEVIRDRFSESSTGTGWDQFETNLRPIHLFLDDLRQPLPDQETWRKLSERGLTRVTIGLSLGDLADSPPDSENITLFDLISAIHQAGISVGPAILIGSTGGVERAISALDRLPWEPTDLVTLIDERILDASRSAELDPIREAEISAQVSAIKSWSSAGRPSKRPKVVVYNPDKQTH